MEGQLGHRVPFAEFAGNPAKYISARLVRKYPGTPFGVTWNGGMAFTRNDCAAAKKAFDAFRTAGEFVKPPPERDPVAPANHLGPLLGW
ncbi:MAG: hypothetical protein JNK22_15020 [Rhodocyclaceae bacterium]|nr:hypothetical protein [Rhodocyclaceae bacterium]